MKNFKNVLDELRKYLNDFNDICAKKSMLVLDLELHNQLVSDCEIFLDGDFSCFLNLEICLDTLGMREYNGLKNALLRYKILIESNPLSPDVEIEKGRIMTYLNRIKNNSKKVQDEINDINEKILSMVENSYTCRNIINATNMRKKINNRDIYNLIEMLKEFGNTNRQIAYVVENIFSMNWSIVARENNYTLKPEQKYKYSDILNYGKEILTLPDLNDHKRRDFLDNYANSIYLTVKSTSYGELSDSNFEYLPRLDIELKNIKELEYVLISVLINLDRDLENCIDLMISPDFLMDLKAKKMGIDDCYILLNKYILIRKRLDEFLDESLYHEEDIEYDEIKSSDSDGQVHYLFNSANKCCLIEDMKEMPEEYLEKTQNLISGLKNGTLPISHIKRLAHRKGFYELKDDQIRIIFTKGDNNSYLIYGAFVKKDDWKYRKDFNRVIGRTINIGENSLDTEANIEEFVKTKKRKGTR